MTNTLLTSGIVLFWAQESHERLTEYWGWLRSRLAKTNGIVQQC